jgi:large subunit ribosomal protein L25
MAEITLAAAPGRVTGSAESRRLRAAGRIPAVVYGHGGEGVAVSVDGRELRHALSGESGTNQLLDLRIAGESQLVLTRMIQRHPVRHTVTHVDFQVVRRDEIVSADVPVVLVGESEAVKAVRANIEQVLSSLTVRANPARIPVSVEVDMSHLQPGGVIRVEDLPLPDGVTADVPGDEVVVLASVGELQDDSETSGDGEGASSSEEG